MTCLIDTSTGEPKVAGTRITVRKVVDVVENAGESEQEYILYEHWELTEEEVSKALEYYDNNREEVEEAHRQKEKIRQDTVLSGD